MWVMGKKETSKIITLGFGTAKNRGPPLGEIEKLGDVLTKLDWGARGRGEETDAQGRRCYLNSQPDVQPISSKFDPKTQNNGHLGKERKVHLRE